ARARQAGRLSEAFQGSEAYKEQARSEERSDDQRKLKITNLTLKDYIIAPSIIARSKRLVK
ncbi:MAG: hypothetical protein D6772_08865, partial [Bacteroidetes bacterium]